MNGRAASGRLPGAMLGMILFISSELMFFGSLFAAYFTIRAAAPSWPPGGGPSLAPLVPGLFSILLVSSSFTQHAAAAAGHRGDRSGAIRWLVITIGLGAAFLAGQGFEYSQLGAEGAAVDTNIYFTLFFTMTGFHGLHVLGGVAALTIVVGKARRGDFDGGRTGPLEAATAYWHFVDVVWVFLFATLYLLK